MGTPANVLKDSAHETKRMSQLTWFPEVLSPSMLQLDTLRAWLTRNRNKMIVFIWEEVDQEANNIYWGPHYIWITGIY